MYRGRAGPGRTPCRAARHRGPQEASPAPSSRSSHQQARLVVRHRLTGPRQQRSQRWSQPTRPACSRPPGGRRRPETPPGKKTRRTWPRRSIGPHWAQPASPSARRSSERRSTTRTTTCPGPAVVASSATRAPACPAPPWRPRIALRPPKPRDPLAMIETASGKIARRSVWELAMRARLKRWCWCWRSPCVAMAESAGARAWVG
jgi:hypothetical protein